MNVERKPRQASSKLFKRCNCSSDEHGNGRRQRSSQTPYAPLGVNHDHTGSSCHGGNASRKAKFTPFIKGRGSRGKKIGNVKTSSHKEQAPDMGVSGAAVENSNISDSDDCIVETIIKTECMVTAAGGVVGTFKPPFVMVFDMGENGQGGTGSNVNDSTEENNNTNTKEVGKDNVDLVYPSPTYEVSEVMEISLQFPKFDEDFDLAYEYLADDLIRMSRDMDLN